MTREQLLSKLCSICDLVYSYKKDYSKSFDCFCGSKGILKGASWEDETIIAFIREAVKEKIEAENAKKVYEGIIESIEQTIEKTMIETPTKLS